FTAYDVVPMTGAPLAGGRFQGASAQELKISEEDAHLAGCVRRRAEAVANFGDLLELPRKPRELLFSCRSWRRPVLKVGLRCIHYYRRHSELSRPPICCA